jgi:LL-diaminopimelate aminotransferase
MSIGFDFSSGFYKMREDYVFAEAGRKIAAFAERHISRKLYRLGVGDVHGPIFPEIITALTDASKEMGKTETFRGYAPACGYDFLRESIADYYARGDIEVSPSEVYVTDGGKNVLFDISSLFECEVLIPTPTYPVYSDGAAFWGKKVNYLVGSKADDFSPDPPDKGKYLIYLCSPSNPTGATMSETKLRKWVDFAVKSGSLIVFDAAYESFVVSGIKSIFSIDGAKSCAIEVSSLSKRSGFTGLRCGYAIIPSALSVGSTSVRKAFERYCASACNGVAYPIQRAAQAALDPSLDAKTSARLSKITLGALAIRKSAAKNGFYVLGGESPYVWLECPSAFSSWEFFDYLLDEGGICCTPGCGFGEGGEGYVRFSSLYAYEDAEEAAFILSEILRKL